MKKATKFYLIVLTCFSLLSCTREEQIVAWMPGTWNINKYQRIQIQNDGTNTILLSESNVGYWNFVDDPLDDEDLIKQYEFYYNGLQGVQSSNGYVQISEQGNRFILLGGPCVGCDDAFNLEYFTPNTFKLTKYSPDTSCSCTYKLSMEMSKE